MQTFMLKDKQEIDEHTPGAEAEEADLSGSKNQGSHGAYYTLEVSMNIQFRS